MERKTKRLWIRISAQDAELIKQKAVNYKTVSSMIWDAIKQFDDTGPKRKIAALNEMTALYKMYQQDFAWMGGTFNQVVKRANELAIANELTLHYFEKVLYPQIMELQKLLTAVKQEQHQIVKRLTR